jgi:hypothetical protein
MHLYKLKSCERYHFRKSTDGKWVKKRSCGKKRDVGLGNLSAAPEIL